MSSLTDYLDSLAQDPEPDPTPVTAPSELVVDRKTGEMRQAGADTSGAWVADFKRAAESSLFTFAVGVLGRGYLTEALHRPITSWLTNYSKSRRKLLLLPREHCKTSIVAHALPIHMLIQPASDNIYFEGLNGRDTTIILACETETRGTDHLRVIETAFESNRILRGLWPHCCWDKPRAESKKWNDHEMIAPRTIEYPDPTIRVIGVDGAITGSHPRVLLKDDLISEKASNSPTVMQTAIQWHVASRALINDPQCIEIIDGTRWAAYDLYRYIEENDPSVELVRRAAIEDGEPIYPERFTLEMLDRLRREFGVLYPLLYMNTAVDAALTDFDMADVRRFEVRGSSLLFDEEERDISIRERDGVEPEAQPRRGQKLSEALAEGLGRRHEFLRLKYNQ